MLQIQYEKGSTNEDFSYYIDWSITEKYLLKYQIYLLFNKKRSYSFYFPYINWCKSGPYLICVREMSCSSSWPKFSWHHKYYTIRIYYIHHFTTIYMVIIERRTTLQKHHHISVVAGHGCMSATSSLWRFSCTATTTATTKCAIQLLKFCHADSLRIVGRVVILITPSR